VTEANIRSSAVSESFIDHFPQGWLSLDDRDGYQGYIIEKDHLLEFARRLRDEHGYDYLSSITGVDYFPEDRMEVVYHVYKSTGGSGIEFKVVTGRDNPEVTSLVSLYDGANFQEREIWDLLGIWFEDHPDPRRILTWEGFAGHPLRKDWTEPYFEEDFKPFDSRWPEGRPERSEATNPFGDNVQFKDPFDPETWVYEGDDQVYEALRNEYSTKDEDLDVEQFIVNMGPQHPSTHGVFRMVVLLDGETIVGLKPVFGYLHRNHEKIGERNTFLQNMPFTDRLDYITSLSNNLGYALAVEKLTEVHPPERAEYIRVIMAELTRIINHLVAIGFLLNDLGAFFTPNLYGLEERELILDIFEAVTGSRMMCNYLRFGGVAHDVSSDHLKQINALVSERLPRKLEDFDKYLTGNEILRSRCEGVGVLTPEDALRLSVTGPLLRASGVPYDIRRADPYSIYDRFEFDVAWNVHGDTYDRFLVRLEEIRQSIRIIKQALRDIPDGPIQTGKVQHQARVPAGESYGRIESPKGELGYYIVSNKKPNPLRYHVRAPSLINLSALEIMCRNQKIADAVVILGSIDITLGEVDR
jgi:NADH-quinone oxidoreductase subunit C/D